MISTCEISKICLLYIDSFVHNIVILEALWKCPKNWWLSKHRCDKNDQRTLNDSKYFQYFVLIPENFLVKGNLNTFHYIYYSICFFHIKKKTHAYCSEELTNNPLWSVLKTTQNVNVSNLSYAIHMITLIRYKQ